MAEIPLTRGKVAVVDECDLERLGCHSWHAAPRPHTTYAASRLRDVKRIAYMHRFILCAPNGTFVDHINGNGLDNRRSNLRLCSLAQNQRNRLRKAAGFSSKYKGVYWSDLKRKWVCQITTATGRTTVGCFKTEEQAREAYAAAALKHYGEFAAPFVVAP